MKKSFLEKFTALTGLISVVLLIIGSVVWGVYDYLPPAESIAETFNNHPGAAMLGGYVVTLSAFFMIWFAGGFYQVLHKQEGDSPLFSRIAFAGGVGSGLALLIGYSAIITIGARAGAPNGIGPDEAVILYDLHSHIMGQMFCVTLALFIGAAAVISLRTGLFPKWSGWLSILIAIGLLNPEGYLVIIFAVLWMLVVSLWMFAR
jgi:hypothetical protein